MIYKATAFEIIFDLAKVAAISDLHFYVQGRFLLWNFNVFMSGVEKLRFEGNVPLYNTSLREGIIPTDADIRKLDGAAIILEAYNQIIQAWERTSASPIKNVDF